MSKPVRDKQQQLAGRTRKATRGRTRVIVESPEPDDDSLLPAEAQKPKEDEDLEEVLSGLPHEAKIELWKWGSPEPDEWNYVSRHPVHGFSLDQVSREHGGGKFRMIIRGPREGDDGRTRIVQLARRHFAVAGPRAAQGDGNVGINMSEMLRINMQMLQTIATAPRESMADMIRAIHEVSASKADPMQMTLQLMTLLQKDKGAINEMMEVLRMGMEIAESKGGGGDNLGAFAKAFAGLLDRVPGQEKKPETPAQPAAPALPATSQDVAEANRMFFETAARVLRSPSEKDADTELYAEWLIDQVEGLFSLHPYLQQWFIDPAYPEMLFPLFPGVRQPWLKAVLIRARDIATGAEEAIEEVKENDDDDDRDSGRGSGHHGDAETHEASGERESTGTEGSEARSALN